MLKSILRLVFLFAACLFLGACAGEEGSAPGAETPGFTRSAGPVTIDLWHSEGAQNGETLDRLVARFNASQDEVRVRATRQGDYLDAMAKLIASIPSGSVPAVAYLDEGHIQKMIDSGAVTPVQRFIDRDSYDLSDLDEKAVEYYTVQDTQWGMPFHADMGLLYYNKQVFREVGLDPEKPPRDLEELRQYAQKIFKQSDSGQVVRSGIAIDIKGWLAGALAQHGDLYVDRSNGHEGRATKVLFDNDTGRWFFQWWHDMVEEGLAFNVGRNPSYADGLLAIASDRAAMTFSFAGAFGSVIDVLEGSEPGAQGIEIGVSQLPGVPEGKGLTGFAVYGLWILKQRPEQEQEAAWKFIKWLVEPEQQAEWFAGTGYLPVSRSSVDLPAVKDILARYPLYQVPLDAYLNTPATPATMGALIGPGDEVAETVAQAVEEMLVAGKDPLKALGDAASNANRILADYNERVGN